MVIDTSYITKNLKRALETGPVVPDAARLVEPDE